MADEKKKVLLIEDDESVRNFLALMVEREGFKVFTAENGRQGFEIADREQPTAIITDMMMPDIGGYEFIKEAQGRLYGTPIIIVTARSFDPVMLKDIQSQSNVITLLKKPISIPALSTALKKAVEKNP